MENLIEGEKQSNMEANEQMNNLYLHMLCLDLSLLVFSAIPGSYSHSIKIKTAFPSHENPDVPHRIKAEETNVCPHFLAAFHLTQPNSTTLKVELERWLTS